MNEPPNDPPAKGIVGAAGSARERPTFSRVLLVSSQGDVRVRPETCIFIYGHTHNASLKRVGERAVINTGTWLKKLERVPARFRLLPSVYHPSFCLRRSVPTRPG